jgi:choline dehydrogenase-like flavoprotein
MDAETVGLTNALQHPNVTLMEGSRVRRLLVGAGGQITGVVVERNGAMETLMAPVIVLSAGAVNTAAMLLASADAAHPNGLANRSDQVGRNFMNHNCSAVLAVHPVRRNDSVYQKTIQVNDWYLTGVQTASPWEHPAIGQDLGPDPGLPVWATPAVAGWIARHSVDLYAMSEDLPNPESRVTLHGDQIVLDWKRSNWKAHEALVAKLKVKLRQAGFPIVLSRPFDRRTPSHQCGTARMGQSPALSVVDSFCRSHDHPNLFVVDASVLPTSAAVNPALTIAALALRAGEHIKQRDLVA